MHDSGGVPQLGIAVFWFAPVIAILGWLGIIMFSMLEEKLSFSSHKANLLFFVQFMMDYHWFLFSPPCLLFPPVEQWAIENFVDSNTVFSITDNHFTLREEQICLLLSFLFLENNV